MSPDGADDGALKGGSEVKAYGDWLSEASSKGDCVKMNEWGMPCSLV